MVPITVVYTLAIALLIVSRLPVYSGKKVGKRVPPDLVLPVFIGVVVFFALLIAYPWAVLTIGPLIYLPSLPFRGRSPPGSLPLDPPPPPPATRAPRPHDPPP